MQNSRKYLLVMLLLAAVNGGLFAQQLPHYTNFIYNYFAYNPAVAGTTKCVELKLGYRDQWKGVPDAPRTAFANLHGKLKAGKWNFHGVGGLVDSDDAGPFSYTSIHLAYAYHARVARRYMLATGISMGFQQFRVDYGAMVMENYSDPAIQGPISKFVMPKVNLGIWLYRGDRFYGISIKNLNENGVEGLGIQNPDIKRHYHFTAGRSIRMNDDLYFKPAININFVSASDPDFDFTAQLEYREKVTIGLGGRFGVGLTGLIKLSVIKYVTLAYAYDLTVNPLRVDGLNTHEIIIGIRACSGDEKSKVPCAAYD
ncbi:MAG: type IX secretion system membrane protein PorP/SprF [Flavobacteriales bacterium]|nr:type IX secretion system membrane protein PorP/SprF [Flavobacteriales bacterium]